MNYPDRIIIGEDYQVRRFGPGTEPKPGEAVYKREDPEPNPPSCSTSKPGRS